MMNLTMINNFLSALIILILLDIKILYCGSNSRPDSITAISLEQQIPIINQDNSMTVIGGTYKVYYYNDLLMYKLNYRFDSMVNNESILQETRSFYFVFHQDSTYGYKFMVKPDNTNTNNKRIQIDTLLKYYRFETNIYDTLINFKPDSIYEEKGKIVKVYKNPPTSNTASQPEKFDLYFYYTRELKDIRETLSKKMDNVKCMKLVKILVKASGGFYKEFNTTFPPREFFLDMKKIGIENKEEILGYFKRYKEERL